MEWMKRIISHRYYDYGMAVVFGGIALLEAWNEMYVVALLMAFTSGVGVGIGMWKPLACEAIECSKELLDTLKRATGRG